MKLVFIINAYDELKNKAWTLHIFKIKRSNHSKPSWCLPPSLSVCVCVCLLSIYLCTVLFDLCVASSLLLPPHLIHSMVSLAGGTLIWFSKLALSVFISLSNTLRKYWQSSHSDGHANIWRCYRYHYHYRYTLLQRSHRCHRYRYRPQM